MISKIKLPIRVLLIITVLINTWSVILSGFLEIPYCKGVETTITAAIPTTGDSNWIHGVDSSGQEVYGRVSTEVQVGDRLILYTSDGSNYWDISEDLVYCDGVLNKPSGFLALGIRKAEYIIYLYNLVTIFSWLTIIMTLFSLVIKGVNKYEKFKSKK